MITLVILTLLLGRTFILIQPRRTVEWLPGLFGVLITTLGVEVRSVKTVIYVVIFLQDLGGWPLLIQCDEPRAPVVLELPRVLIHIIRLQILKVLKSSRACRLVFRWRPLKVSTCEIWICKIVVCLLGRGKLLSIIIIIIANHHTGLVLIKLLKVA